MAPIRIPFALASGLLLALAGFFGLVQLIGAPLDVGERVIADRVIFTPQIRRTPPDNKRDPKVVREQPELIPTGPRIISDDFGDDVIATLRPSPTKISLPGRYGGLQMGVDRDAIPLVRINPEYPPRERGRGVEGWVLVQFTVTATGTVRDAVVVDSEPKAVFDRAALDAIGRWRYNPRVDRGLAVDRVGLQTVIRFRLEGQENGV